MILGGEFATAPRAGISEDLGFIQAQRAKGVPISAIARMIGRNDADVAAIAAMIQAPAARKPYRPPSPKQARPRRTPRRPSRRVLPKGFSVKAFEVVSKVAAFYGVTVDEMIGPSRKKAIAEIRQEAYHALYETGRYSLPTIGGYFGGRDHTTIMHGIRSHKARLAARQAEAA